MIFRVFNRRWGHEDTNIIDITDEGWNIYPAGPVGGISDTRGNPGLFEILNHDSINYPHDIGNYLNVLWRRAKQDKMSEEQIQMHLNVLAKWVSECEQSTPRGIFSEYN
jgi:hypothetical protein